MNTFSDIFFGCIFCISKELRGLPLPLSLDACHPGSISSSLREYADSKKLPHHKKDTSKEKDSPKKIKKFHRASDESIM
jgi:hypothetical protein